MLGFRCPRRSGGAGAQSGRKEAHVVAQTSSSTSEPATSSAPLPWPCAAAWGAAASHARGALREEPSGRTRARGGTSAQVLSRFFFPCGAQRSLAVRRACRARARALALGSRGGADKDPLPYPQRGGVAMRGGPRARGGERGGVVRVFCHPQRRPHARRLDSNLAAAPLRRPPKHSWLALAPCPAPVLAPLL